MNDDNTKVFIRIHQAIETRDQAAIEKAIDEVIAPDVIFHAPMPSGMSGVQAMKNVWIVLLRAFPDIRVTIEDIIAEGDKVAYRSRVTGTHLGEYRGAEPTGRRVAYDEMFIVRYADGLAAEIWGVVDVYAQLRQIGLAE
ncbi:ester cyclase [Hamadaea tsunoensis]|uniref:ester cyclase n=1 Tax=Hamadaea tsunoensis TaxID=53368 RepID=UPI00040CA1DB|nr:ester cyclase [Hamadaea tsunoensis]